MSTFLKRLPSLLLVALPLLLSACADQRPSPELLGQWSGEVKALGASLPLDFTVDRDYRVQDGDFHFTYSDSYLDFSVTSTVTGNTLKVDAVASSADGTLTFQLRATVAGDTLSGTYSLIGRDGSGNEFLNAGGSFTATRTG